MSGLSTHISPPLSPSLGPIGKPSIEAQTLEASRSEELDIGTVPPPHPFSTPPIPPLSTPMKSTYTKDKEQNLKVFVAEKPPLAEEEPDFQAENFDTVFITSQTIKDTVKSHLEASEEIHLTKAELGCDSEPPMQTSLVQTSLMTDNKHQEITQAKSAGEVESKEEPNKQNVGDELLCAYLNKSDEDKMMKHILSSTAPQQQEPKVENSSPMEKKWVEEIPVSKWLEEIPVSKEDSRWIEEQSQNDNLEKILAIEEK